MPCNDSLNQSVGTSARRDAHLIIGKDGERTVQVFLVDVAQRFHKGVILSVTGRSGLILFAVNLHTDVGTRFQSIRCVHHITDQFHLIVRPVMFQHIADNIRQVFLCHNLLLVTQLGNALRHTACLFWSQFKSQFLQVLGNVGFA